MNLWFAILAIASFAVAQYWPTAPSIFRCEGSDLHLAQGVLACGPGGPLTPAVAASMGLPMDLNRASVDDLVRIPGLQRRTAEALISARESHGRFQTWEEISAVRGVGPKRLAALQAGGFIDSIVYEK